MTVWLRGGHTFTTTGGFERRDVVIEDGRITALPAHDAPPGRATVIDLEGRWALPGFVDLHVHLTYKSVPPEPTSAAALRGAYRAQRTLASGVTTVRDVGGYDHTDLALKRAIDRGWLPGPRMLPSGQFIMMTGGHVCDQGMEADGPEAIRKAVRVQLKAGARWIKLMASGGVSRAEESPDRSELTLEEIRAAVDEARRHGVSVAAHAHPAVAIKEALRAGAASIEHGTYLDDEAIDLLRKTGAFVVPTTVAYEHIAKSGKWPDIVDIAQRVLDHKLRTFADAVRHGIRWGVGTDTSNHLPPGHYARELTLLQAAGLEPREILLQATSGNARLLDLGGEIGSLSVGHLGDVVVLDGNPLEALSATERVHLVVKGGRVYWPRDLAAEDES